MTFQHQVLELCKRYRWKVYTQRWNGRGRPGISGWPDIFACRDGRIIVLELKAEKGIVSDAQAEWIVALAQVPGVIAKVVRPSELQEIAGWLA